MPHSGPSDSAPAAMSHQTLTWSPATQDPFPCCICLPCELTLCLFLASLLVLVRFPVLYAFLVASLLFLCLPCRFDRHPPPPPPLLLLSRCPASTGTRRPPLCLVLCLFIIMLCLSCPYCLHVCLTILALPLPLIRFLVVCFPCCFLTVACLPCISLFRGEGGESRVRSCVSLGCGNVVMKGIFCVGLMGMTVMSTVEEKV